MGTLRWDASKPMKGRGNSAPSVVGEFYDSGGTTTSGTATDIDSGAPGGGSDVSFPIGVILSVTGDEAMWLKIGGVAAAAYTGFYLPANVTRDIEITVAGLVSVIDEA